MPEFASTGNARTAYERRGSGPLLLLMHGAEASREQFAALMPLLEPHFTAVAYDQRDCGATESPPRAATLAELADDAAALLDALDVERAHVFGSSFGGRVAQALAIRHPHRVGRLVLGSTWPLPQTLEALNPDGVARIVALRAGLPQSSGELAAMFFPEPYLEATPALRQLFADVQPFTERSQRRGIAVGSSIDADPSAIEAPTLLLAGALDRVVPPAITLSMAERIAYCEQAVLGGVGHATSLQAPAEVAAHLLRFLLAA